MSPSDNIQCPFPALTSVQRWHLEVHGYAVVEEVVSTAEVDVLRDAIYRLRTEFLALDDPWNGQVRSCYMHGENANWNHHQFTNLVEVDPLFRSIATHPRIVGMAEEVVGRGVRTTETAAAITSRHQDSDYDGPDRVGWHRHRPEALTYTVNGLFHCEYVKAITYLTDVGPDDGGTVVIPGCHKSDCPEEAIIKAARQDPSLVHQVVAPAGSTLLFCETLLHAIGDLRSDRERVVVISGYKPWNVRPGTAVDFSPGFADEVPEHQQRLIFGSQYDPRLRRRSLEMAVGSADPGDYLDGFSLDHGNLDSIEGNRISKSRLQREPT